MKTWLVNGLLTVVSVLVATVAAELVLRYHYLGVLLLPKAGPSMSIPHPTRSFVNRPDSEGYIRQFDAIVPYRFNKAGYRGPEIDDPKRRFRILIVGDSAVMGSGARNEDVFPNVLERELGTDLVEVVNAGTAAYNAVQILLALRDGLALQPDLVIFGFAPVNDIQGSARGLRKLFKENFKRAVAYLNEDGQLEIDISSAQSYYEKNKYRLSEEKKPGYMKSLVLYQMAKKAIDSFSAIEQNDPNILLGWPFLANFEPEYSTHGLGKEEYQQLWEEGWDVAKRILLEARREAEGAGARFAVLAMPGKVQVVQQMQTAYLAKFPKLNFDLTRFNRNFDEFAREAGIPSLDALTPLLEARDAGTSGLYHEIDHHLAAPGHAVVGRALAEQLRALGLVGSN